MALSGRYTGELGHTAPVLAAGASMHTAAPPVQIFFGKRPKPRTLWSPSSEDSCGMKMAHNEEVEARCIRCLNYSD